MTRAFLSFFAASGGVSGCQVPTSSDWQLLKLQFSPLLADWPVAMMEGTTECPKNWKEFTKDEYLSKINSRIKHVKILKLHIDTLMPYPCSG